HKVLIDVGTGIFLGNERGARRMGADVRIVAPGDGCLLCCGGLTDPVGAIEGLTQQSRRPSGVDWPRQRAGSLRSLNQLATAQALQILQDFVAERVGGSLWTRMEISSDGRLQTSHPPLAMGRNCNLCSLAGLGDRELAAGRDFA